MAARLLASTGKSRFAPTLVRLTGDADAEVRDAVGHGLSEILDYPLLEPDGVEDALALALYDYMRDCALRTDRGPGVNFASALFRADRARAARDFGDDGVLNIGRNWLRDLLTTLRAEGIDVPLATVRKLLDDAMRILDCEGFALRDYPSISDVVSELLLALVKHDPSAARTLVRTLSRHKQEEARKAAQDVREQLSNVDPVRIAIEANEAVGGDVSRMRWEHRVIYHVWLLDAEVANGGWLQWAANPSGAYAADTLKALRELGLNPAAQELQIMIDALGPGGLSPDQKRRMTAIDRAMDCDRPMPDDGTIWQMSTHIRAAMLDYAEAHPDAFPTS